MRIVDYQIRIRKENPLRMTAIIVCFGNWIKRRSYMTSPESVNRNQWKQLGLGNLFSAFIETSFSPSLDQSIFRIDLLNCFPIRWCERFDYSLPLHWTTIFGSDFPRCRIAFAKPENMKWIKIGSVMYVHHTRRHAFDGRYAYPHSNHSSLFPSQPLLHEPILVAWTLIFSFNLMHHLVRYYSVGRTLRCWPECVRVRANTKTHKMCRRIKLIASNNRFVSVT